MRGWIVGGALAVVVMLVAGPAMAEKTAHFEKSFQASAVGEVQVDLSFLDVEVVAAPGDTVGVSIDLETKHRGARADEALRLAMPVVTVVNRVLEIRAQRTKHHWWSSRKVSGTVTIHLPPGPHITIDTSSGDCRLKGDLGTGGTDVETSSGDIVLRGAVSDAEINTSSGDVRLDLTRPAGAVEVETSSGDVTVHGELTRLEVQTSSGEISLNGVCRKAELDSSSGDLEVHWTRVPSGSLADLETSSGDVALTVPVGTAVAGMVTTSSGTISSAIGGDLGSHKRVLSLTAPSPVLRLEVSTSSGDVELRAAGH